MFGDRFIRIQESVQSTLWTPGNFEDYTRDKFVAEDGPENEARLTRLGDTK